MGEVNGNRASKLSLSTLYAIGSPVTEQDFEAYFDLRWRILRAPWSQPRGSERDEYEPRAEHLYARDADGRVVGVGRLHRIDSTTAQIRFMAVEENMRRSGIGSAILNRLEQLAADRGVHRIVVNARDDVVGFYLGRGYVDAGDGPVLFGAIKHRAMKKSL